MKRLLLASLLAGTALTIAVAEPALGQTPPPPPGPPGNVPPTAVRSPTMAPSTGALAMLQAMQTAMLSSGTLHFSLTSKAVAPGVRQVVMTTDGDVSFSSDAVHYATTIVRTRLNKEPHISMAERNELEAVGQRAAWRVPHLSWQCESLLNAAASRQLLAFQAQPQSATVVGTRTVGGVTVTNIRARATLYPWTGNQIDTVDYDISPQTGAALRITSTFATRLNGTKAHQTVTELYSAYSTPVSVTLPKKCRGA